MNARWAIEPDTPILIVEEMRAADAYTIANGTPSIELMQRAARGIFDIANDRGLWQDKSILVICGSGNNGGDGYALAEILHAHGYAVTLIRVTDTFSEDGEYYYKRCMDAGVKETTRIETEQPFGEMFAHYDVLVDCILGTGFSGVPRDHIAAVIRGINEAKSHGAYVISADINSGMNGDTGEAKIAVQSDLTVSIGYLKQGFFRGRAEELIGDLVNVDIGIELSE